MSLPYMPLYVGDYLADTGHLSAAENGAYLLLIMHYWRAGSLPADDEMRRRISRMTHREWNRSRDTILAFFSSDGKHKRVDEELARVNHKSAVLRDNALKSHEARRAIAQQKLLPGTCIPEPEPEPEKNISLASLARAPESDADGERLKAEKKARRAETVAFIQEVVGRWNVLASDWKLPPVRDITEPRQRAILARSKDFTETYDFTEPITGFEALFAKVRASPFLRGEKGWRADFDFAVVSKSSFTKIMEGKYEAEARRFK